MASCKLLFPRKDIPLDAVNGRFVRSAELDLLPQCGFGVLARRTAALSPYRSFCKLSDAANAPGCSRPKSAVDEICMRRIPAYPKQPFNTLCSVIVGQRAALRTKPASSTPVHFLLPLEHSYQLVAFTLVLIADVHIGYALMNEWGSALLVGNLQWINRCLGAVSGNVRDSTAGFCRHNCHQCCAAIAPLTGPHARAGQGLYPIDVFTFPVLSRSTYRCKADIFASAHNR